VTASQHDGLGIVVEGAVDRFCGRPLQANPYSPTFAADAHAGWVFGWREADYLLEIRGQDEARRWLTEAA
jgi:hypothetical protein